MSPAFLARETGWVSGIYPRWEFRREGASEPSVRWVIWGFAILVPSFCFFVENLKSQWVISDQKRGEGKVFRGLRWKNRQNLGAMGRKFAKNCRRFLRGGERGPPRRPRGWKGGENRGDATETRAERDQPSEDDRCFRLSFRFSWIIRMSLYISAKAACSTFG